MWRICSYLGAGREQLILTWVHLLSPFPAIWIFLSMSLTSITRSHAKKQKRKLWTHNHRLKWLIKFILWNKPYLYASLSPPSTQLPLQGAIVMMEGGCAGGRQLSLADKPLDLSSSCGWSLGFLAKLPIFTALHFLHLTVPKRICSPFLLEHVPHQPHFQKTWWYLPSQLHHVLRPGLPYWEGRCGWGQVSTSNPEADKGAVHHT